MTSKLVFENFIRRELSKLQSGLIGPDALLSKFADLVRCCLGINRGQIEEIFEDDISDNGDLVM